MIESLWAFLAISALVIVTPGPDTLVTVRNALIGGRGAGIATAFGVATGQIIWVLATSLGLVALLLASEPLFNAIKLLGAIYLMWLGLQAITHAVRSNIATPGLEGKNERPRLRPTQAFRHGLLSDLGNPKMAVFFASVLPQFAPQGEGMLSALVLLGFVFAALALAWLTLYSIAVTAVGGILARSSVRRTVEGTMGGILVLLGLRLVVEQR